MKQGGKIARVGSRFRKRVRTWLTVGGLLVWTALPMGIVAVLTVQSATATVYPRSNVLVSPEPGTGEIRRPVGIELRWTPGTDLIAPAWNGVVVKVLAGVGTEVTNGTPLLVVDGVTRVAAATTEPFYRMLELGAVGTDVQDLNAFLRSRSFAAPESNLFTRQTLSAVRSFAAAIGVPSASRVSSFDPAWVIFLPTAGTIAESHALLGAPAIGPGEPVFGLAPSLVEAALVTPVASSGGTENPDQKDENKALDPTATALPDESLSVGDVALKLTKARQYLADESLPVLAKQVPANTRTVSAVLTLSLKADQWLVPAPAVILDANGVACVHVAEGDSYRSIVVSPMTTFDGRTAVEGSINQSTKVIVYAPDVAVSCK